MNEASFIANLLKINSLNIRQVRLCDIVSSYSVHRFSGGIYSKGRCLSFDVNEIVGRNSRPREGKHWVLIRRLSIGGDLKVGRQNTESITWSVSLLPDFAGYYKTYRTVDVRWLALIKPPL